MMVDDTQTPLITIGITCYNACDTIARAIKSALKQDWNNIEILIVDDCSSDSSVSIIQNISDVHTKIRLVVHKTNQGPAASRQTIIDNSYGEFIAFFDDDDEAFPQRCSEQYKKIISYEREENIDLLACYTSGRRLYPNGYEVELKAIGSHPIVPRGSEMADYLLFYGKKRGVFYGVGTPSCALMARKNTFDRVGGFDPAFRRVEDIDFAVRLSLIGGHFIGCKEVLFIQHATESYDKSPAKNLESEIQLAEKHKNYLRAIGRYEYARRWPLVRYHHFMGEHCKMLVALFHLFLRAPIKTSSHFLQTAPRRFIHEIKMKKDKKA